MKRKRNLWIGLVAAGILSAAFIGLGIASQCILCGSPPNQTGIYGNVTIDPTGGPAAGIRICFLCDTTTGCDTSSNITCFTDANGNYEVFLGPNCSSPDVGWYTVLVGQCNPVDSCYMDGYDYIYWGGGYDPHNYVVECNP